MEQRYILTAFSKDRLGVIADVTGLLFKHGCNIEDTNMSRITDEFIAIMLFTKPGDDVMDELTAECGRLETEKGISAFIRRLEPEIKGNSVEPIRTHLIHAEGVDQAGIVYKISSFMANNSINIIRLISRKKEPSEDGKPFYEMEIEFELEKERSLTDLGQELMKIGDELQTEILFEW